MKGNLSGILADQTVLPAIDIESGYQSNGQTHAKISSGNNDVQILNFDADYHLKSHDYRGSLLLNTESPDWINALAEVFEAKASLEGPVALSWSGQGNAKNFKDPNIQQTGKLYICLLYTSPSPRDGLLSRMPSSA